MPDIISTLQQNTVNMVVVTNDTGMDYKNCPDWSNTLVARRDNALRPGIQRKSVRREESALGNIDTVCSLPGFAIISLIPSTDYYQRL
jgi:hypothetical protein